MSAGEGAGATSVGGDGGDACMADASSGGAFSAGGAADMEADSRGAEPEPEQEQEPGQAAEAAAAAAAAAREAELEEAEAGQRLAEQYTQYEAEPFDADGGDDGDAWGGGGDDDDDDDTAADAADGQRAGSEAPSAGHAFAGLLGAEVRKA